MDKTEHVLPHWNPEEPPKEANVQLPRRSRRIAERNEKITVDVGSLQRPTEEAIEKRHKCPQKRGKNAQQENQRDETQENHR
jgi:hypothetical protein